LKDHAALTPKNLQTVSHLDQCAIDLLLTIVLVPLIIKEVLGERGIMSSTKTTPMVIDCEEFVFLLFAWLSLNDSGAKIKFIDGKLNLYIELVSSRSTRAEALKMQNENIGSSPDLNLLRRSHWLLTAWTIPCVILREYLFFAVLVQTIVQSKTILLPRRACFPLLL